MAGIDLCAFDVETANPARGSICQVGLARFEDGHVVEKVVGLVLPHPDLRGFNVVQTRIHGIRRRDVIGQPEWPAVLAWLDHVVGDLPVFAHCSSFEASAVRQACEAYAIPTPGWQVGCTCRAAKRLHPELANHKLPTVCERYGVTQEHHHDAGDDALVCGELAVAMAREHGGIEQMMRQARQKWTTV